MATLRSIVSREPGIRPVDQIYPLDTTEPWFVTQVEATGSDPSLEYAWSGPFPTATEALDHVWREDPCPWCGAPDDSEKCAAGHWRCDACSYEERIVDGAVQANK